MRQPIFVARFTASMADKAVDDPIKNARNGCFVAKIVGEHMAQRVIRKFWPVTHMLIEQAIEPSANILGKPPSIGLKLRKHATMTCLLYLGDIAQEPERN